MSDAKPLIWKGKVIGDSIGDLMKVVVEIAERGDRQEAKQFLDAYQATCDKPGVAMSNIGYCSGYYSNERMARIQDIFNASHPVFGRTIPSAKEAFEAGIEAGKKNHDKG